MGELGYALFIKMNSASVDVPNSFFNVFINLILLTLFFIAEYDG